MQEKSKTKRIICQNRQARYDYEVQETIEAGIVLKGTEIKSVVNNHVSLIGSYAVVKDGEVTLLNCNIDLYKQGNMFNHEPQRPRRLLLHKAEIKKLADKSKIKGFTLIPLSMYILGSKAKIELGVCRGKQVHDKRAAIKDREMKREMK